MSNRSLPQDAEYPAELDAIQPSVVDAVNPAPRRRSRLARRSAWHRQFAQDGPIDVSVCIANWNCQALLHACLESLQDQPQGVRLEVIVVDNGSADGAPEMVNSEFPEVLLVRNQNNEGFSRANNMAAAKARGRYLFFLNNDTIVPPYTLRRLVDYAERHPEAGMIGPRLRDGHGRFQVSYRQRPGLATLMHRISLLRWTGLFKRAYRRYRRQHFDPYTVRNVDLLMGAAVLLSRQRFETCGGWDEDFVFGGEDLELSARINRVATVVYVPQAEIIHLGRVASRLQIGFASTQMAVGLVRYLRKVGYNKPAVFTYKLFVFLDAPPQLVGKVIQTGYRLLMGRKQDAKRSRLAAVGLVHFLARGLGSFLRA